MKKEVFDFIGKELKYVGIVFALIFIALKIAFYKESLFVVLRASISLLWLFVLPGYFLMLYWREKLQFLERLVIGIALAAAVIGIASYYLGLAGLHIKYHTFLLPALFIVAGIIISALNKKQIL